MRPSIPSHASAERIMAISTGVTSCTDFRFRQNIFRWLRTRMLCESRRLRWSITDGVAEVKTPCHGLCCHAASDTSVFLLCETCCQIQKMRLVAVPKRIDGASLNDAFSPIQRIAMRPLTGCALWSWLRKLSSSFCGIILRRDTDRDRSSSPTPRTVRLM